MSGIGIPYLSSAATIGNQALDAIGVRGKTIGDVNDGTDIAEAMRRNYGQGLRQLLRANHWPWARKYAQLTLLGDASGQTPTVSAFVESPWLYAYAWPIDGVQGRWMPYTPPSAQPEVNGVPVTTGQSPPLYYGNMPARFLVSSSDQYPVEIGTVPWLQQPDLQRTEGVGPITRKIILTNVCNAYFVYTRLVTTIEEWDDAFRQSMVALMALVLIPIAIDDPKERMAQRNAMLAIVKSTLADARAQASNESGYPMSTDSQPLWIRARGGWNLGLGGDGGYSGYPFMPYDTSFAWAGSSVF